MGLREGDRSASSRAGFVSLLFDLPSIIIRTDSSVVGEDSG